MVLETIENLSSRGEKPVTSVFQQIKSFVEVY